MKWVLGIIAWGLLGQNIFGAQLFHHEIVSYPIQGTTCEKVAESLAFEFGKHAGVEIYWAGPEKLTTSHCDIKISYLAETRLSILSSVDRGLMTSPIDRGAYASLTKCLNALKHERRLFFEQTGATPWLSYCYPEEWFFGRFSYVPVVEGVGQSNKRIYNSETIFSDAPIQGWETLLSEIVAGARANGIAAASIFALPHISADQYRVWIRFYHPERLWLSVKKYAPHSDSDICRSQIESVRQGLQQASVPPVTAYCSKSMGQFHLNIVGLSVSIFGPHRINFDIDPKKTQSLQRCLEERKSTENFYSEKLGKKVLTSFCFNENKNSFRTLVIQDDILNY